MGLARRIVDVAQRLPVEPWQPRDYATLESAFRSTLTSGPGERRLRITVVAPSKDDSARWPGRLSIREKPGGMESLPPAQPPAAGRARLGSSPWASATTPSSTT